MSRAGRGAMILLSTMAQRDEHGALRRFLRCCLKAARIIIFRISFRWHFTQGERAIYL